MPRDVNNNLQPLTRFAISRDARLSALHELAMDPWLRENNAVPGQPLGCLTRFGGVFVAYFDDFDTGWRRRGLRAGREHASRADRRSILYLPKCWR